MATTKKMIITKFWSIMQGYTQLSNLSCSLTNKL